MSPDRYIIRLNRVDMLTLSGVITCALAIGSTLNGHHYLATGFLFLAMLGDALDGMLARHLGLERNFGRYLDGFMDMLVYLVSPGLILHVQGFNGLWSAFVLVMIMCGSTRLAVFNDIGNIKENDSLAYLGMPVFWSVFILAGFLLLAAAGLPELLLHSGMALALLAFSHAMLVKKPFFKFKKLSHILAITLGGTLLFFGLHLLGTPHG